MSQDWSSKRVLDDRAIAFCDARAGRRFTGQHARHSGSVGSNLAEITGKPEYCTVIATTKYVEDEVNFLASLRPPPIQRSRTEKYLTVTKYDDGSSTDLI